MVALSDLESNIFDKVSKWKRHAVFTEDDAPIINSESVVISEHGDLRVTQIRQPQKRLNKAEITQAIAEYQDGMTTYQLAEKYGCDRQTISNVLKRHDVNVSKCKAANKIDSKEVIAMYTGMHTSEQIAKHCGVSPSVILKCLRSNGVHIRSRWEYRI